MIVDMVTMHIVQAAIMDEIEMIAMRDHQMAVSFTMHMVGVERRIEHGFGVWVLLADFEHVLINMSVMGKVEVSIM